MADLLALFEMGSNGRFHVCRVVEAWHAWFSREIGPSAPARTSNRGQCLEGSPLAIPAK
jgi:hypothetical protein